MVLDPNHGGLDPNHGGFSFSFKDDCSRHSLSGEQRVSHVAV